LLQPGIVVHFIKALLRRKYPNVKIIDSIIPIKDRVNTRKVFKRESAIKKIDIIRNRISNI